MLCYQFTFIHSIEPYVFCLTNIMCRLLGARHDSHHSTSVNSSSPCRSPGRHREANELIRGHTAMRGGEGSSPGGPAPSRLCIDNHCIVLSSLEMASFMDFLSVCLFAPPPPDCSSGRSGGLVSFLHSCDPSIWHSIRCRVSVQYIFVESMNELKYSQIKISLQVVLSVMGRGGASAMKRF